LLRASFGSQQEVNPRMRKLDPGRPWGKITPPWSGDNKEFDRPAVKEQDGRLFDQYNCEILPPGKTTKRAASIQGPAPPTVAAPSARS